jgi:hypothetical protein
MSNITFSIEDFVSYEDERLKEFPPKLNSKGYRLRGYSPKEMAIVHKYFNGRTTVDIPVIPIALNGGYGGFGLSEEAEATLIDKMGQENFVDAKGQCSDVMASYGSVNVRTNPVLIETILELGFEKASNDCCSLYFSGIPANHTDCVEISEYDGAESVKFNYDKAVQKLVIDETISSDEFRY